ncbi:MAG: hypothetical protein ACRBBW_21295 [Cellvibrionaceae bacterium]
MSKTTHIRVNCCIQDIETRDVQQFDSINKAKRYSRKNFSGDEIMKGEKLLPPKEEAA